MTDAAFTDGLALYVRTYARIRADAGATMSVEEIIGGLVGVIASAIEQCPSGEYRRRLIAATHGALDDRILQALTPTSEAVN